MSQRKKMSLFPPNAIFVCSHSYVDLVCHLQLQRTILYRDVVWQMRSSRSMAIGMR